MATETERWRGPCSPWRPSSTRAGQAGAQPGDEPAPGSPNTAAAADFTKSIVLLTPQWVSFSAGVVAIWGFWALAHQVTQGPTE